MDEVTSVKLVYNSFKLLDQLTRGFLTKYVKIIVLKRVINANKGYFKNPN